MFHIFTVKFYTAIRMNELKLHTVIWVYLKNNVERNREYLCNSIYTEVQIQVRLNHAVKRQYSEWKGIQESTRGALWCWFYSASWVCSFCENVSSDIFRIICTFLWILCISTNSLKNISDTMHIESSKRSGMLPKIVFHLIPQWVCKFF